MLTGILLLWLIGTIYRPSLPNPVFRDGANRIVTNLDKILCFVSRVWSESLGRKYTTTLAIPYQFPVSLVSLSRPPLRKKNMKFYCLLFTRY